MSLTAGIAGHAQRSICRGECARPPPVHEDRGNSAGLSAVKLSTAQGCRARSAGGALVSGPWGSIPHASARASAPPGKWCPGLSHCSSSGLGDRSSPARPSRFSTGTPADDGVTRVRVRDRPPLQESEKWAANGASPSLRLSPSGAGAMAAATSTLRRGPVMRQKRTWKPPVLWGGRAVLGDGHSPGPGLRVRDGGRITVTTRVRRRGRSRSSPKGDTTCPPRVRSVSATPLAVLSMPNPCRICGSPVRLSSQSVPRTDLDPAGRDQKSGCAPTCAAPVTTAPKP